jgi:hypothetical protein
MARAFLRVIELHSKANDEAVFLYAFDVLELNGDDLSTFSPLTSCRDGLSYQSDG